MIKKFNCYYNNRILITEENNYDYFKSFIVCEIFLIMKRIKSFAFIQYIKINWDADN